MDQRSRIDVKAIGRGFVPGLTVALVSIPEGMAYALVAGVNPVYGLYTGMVTTIVASLTLSSSLMIVTLTNAMALVTAETLHGLNGEVDIAVLFTLTFLVGVFMFALGALRLGSLIRYVSTEVMAAFVFTTAFLIVLGQFGELVGYESELDAGRFLQAVDSLRHIGEWSFETAAVGAISIVALLLMKRVNAIARFADVLVIVAATAIVLVTGWTDVMLVGDVGDIPRSLPTPKLPDFSLIPILVTGAVAATVVGLAESAGIGSAYPNKDGRRSNMSQDFTSQGLSNIAGSFFQAMPAAGSLSRTGVNVSAGALTRWSGVFAGVLLAAAVVFIGPLAELIPLAGLAALLIVIGVEVMRKEWPEILMAARVERLNGIVMAVIVFIGVYEDLTVAIFAGVLLSIALYAHRSAGQLRVEELALDDQDRLITKPVSDVLESGGIAVVELVGTSYFATTYSLDDLLPSTRDASGAVLIIRVRHRNYAYATSIKFMMDHAKTMRESGNLLMFSGASAQGMKQLEASGALDEIGREYVFPATPVLGESTRQAKQAAEAWIASRRAD